MRGLDALGYKYNGALDALQSIARTEGIRGLYRGLWPNLREYFGQITLGWRNLMGPAVKVAPSIATSFFTYELVKEMLGAS